MTHSKRLIRRHQARIYNIGLRMLYWPNDAEDVTQEILIKLMTKLSTFEGRSSFRTWLYRIAVNHILNVKRRSFEDRLNFVEYGRGLDATSEMHLPDPNALHCVATADPVGRRCVLHGMLDGWGNLITRNGVRHKTS